MRSRCGWSVPSGTTPPCGWAGGGSIPRHASPAPLKPECSLPAPSHHARATGAPQSRRAAPCVRHRGSGRCAWRVVRHQRHGGAVAGGARHGVGGERRGGRPGRPAVAVQLGFCLRTPRELPSRPPRRRGADGSVAVRPPRAPWRLMCAGELMGWGAPRGAPPPISGRFGGYPPLRAAGPAARTPAGTWAQRTAPLTGIVGRGRRVSTFLHQSAPSLLPAPNLTPRSSTSTWLAR
eukprot:gene10610-biopygen257